MCLACRKGPDFGIHEYKGPRDAESLSIVASKLDHPLLIKFNKAAAQSPVPTFVLCSTSEEDLTVCASPEPVEWVWAHEHPV